MTSSRASRSWAPQTRAALALVLFSSSGAVFGFTGCHDAPPLPVASGSLGGAVARVGATSIGPALLTEVARRKLLAPASALDDLVADALAAQGAGATGFGEHPSVAWGTTTALARTIPVHLVDEARAMGAPTDAERSLVQVVHAVVMRSPTLREETAIAIATAVRRAVRGATTPEQFKARAGAVAHSGIGVVAEVVGPFGPDGRGSAGEEFDAGFVAAAFELHTPFEPGPIVVTPFGWHVVALVERRAMTEPARSAPELVEAVTALRARTSLQALLQLLRERESVEVSTGADDLMAQGSANP